MTTLRGRPSSVGISGSSVARSVAAYAAMSPLVLLLVVLLGAGCSSSRAGRPAVPAAPPTPRPPSELPTHALSLLAKSRTDSCSICAEKLRKDAFEELAQVYRPGVILASAQEGDLLRVAGEEPELMVAAQQDGEPTLTFRFHTVSNHLVGIAETDFTDEEVARQLLSIPVGARLRGRIEIVAYEYGDGATFLYSTTGNHLEIQCKLLEIAAE
jgi:hypothetical protein